jgi:hypothetical protein
MTVLSAEWVLRGEWRVGPKQNLSTRDSLPTQHSALATQHYFLAAMIESNTSRNTFTGCAPASNPPSM